MKEEGRFCGGVSGGVGLMTRQDAGSCDRVASTIRRGFSQLSAVFRVLKSWIRRRQEAAQGGQAQHFGSAAETKAADPLQELELGVG